MKLFRNDLYTIRAEGHRVFVRWLKPMTEWEPEVNERYLPALQDAVKKSVDAVSWKLISEPNPSGNPAYREYVEKVRTEFIAEYRMEKRHANVRIGTYHMGMLVLSFPAEPAVVYPYYYRGVQLSPIEEGTTMA